MTVATRFESRIADGGIPLLGWLAIVLREIALDLAWLNAVLVGLAAIHPAGSPLAFIA